MDICSWFGVRQYQLWTPIYWNVIIPWKFYSIHYSTCITKKRTSVYYYYSLYFANKIFMEIIFSLVMLSIYVIYLIFVSATWPLQKKFSNPCNRCDTHTITYLFFLIISLAEIHDYPHFQIRKQKINVKWFLSDRAANLLGLAWVWCWYLYFVLPRAAFLSDAFEGVSV